MRGYRRLGRPVAVVTGVAVLGGTAWRLRRRLGVRSTPDSSAGGQVSEVASFGDGPEPIYPDQATGGYPDSESGRPDEGPAGPNARPDWAGPGTGA